MCGPSAAPRSLAGQRFLARALHFTRNYRVQIVTDKWVFLPRNGPLMGWTAPPEFTSQMIVDNGLNRNTIALLNLSPLPLAAILILGCLVLAFGVGVLICSRRGEERAARILSRFVGFAPFWGMLAAAAFAWLAIDFVNKTREGGVQDLLLNPIAWIGLIVSLLGVSLLSIVYPWGFAGRISN